MEETAAAGAASRHNGSSSSSSSSRSGSGSGVGGVGVGSATPPLLGSLLLLQHPPVYTLGTGATEGHLKFDPAASPLPLYRTERGGEVRRALQCCCCCRASPRPPLFIARCCPPIPNCTQVTYHGPGQLVLYPILDLRCAPLRPDLHWYLRSLEEVVVRWGRE